MKLALVTTTINIPTVLSLYRRFDPSASVRFFCAGDMKSPSVPSRQFCENLDNCHFYDVVEQQALGYKCSELLGWNTDARRNIAALEALKWGADAIIFSDDDNYPLSPNYFYAFDSTLSESFSGLKVNTRDLWFDPGRLLDPVAQQRGLPFGLPYETRFRHVVDAKVGVAAGMCLGDPDQAAVTRIERGPIVHRVSEVLRNGIVLDPKQHITAFNSQNTCVLRMLAPCMFIWPGSGTAQGAGRNSDIYASLITQRIMRDYDLHVHLGQPFIWQERNPHNLLSDLRGELWAMEHVEMFAEYLGRYETVAGSVVEKLRDLYTDIGHAAWCPPGVSEAALAFLDDCEKVLAVEPFAITRGPNYEEMAKITREAFGLKEAK